ncbi:MAG: TraB/GumN family protein [Campylobacteraceae bacterium]|nr:TraB/GumN family protein [Campylobacteraceae bacterium]
MLNKYILVFILLYSSLYAKSSVWKVSKDSNHFYIAGTIHALSKADYDLPKEYEEAYNNSSVIVFEADTNKLSQESFSYLINTKTRYKKNDSLDNYLDNDTKEKLKKYLSAKDIIYKNIKNLKPGILSIYLTSLELKKLKLTALGVDAYYSLKAKEDNKKIKYLESIYKQLDFLSSMSKGYENEFVNYTLKDLENIKKQFFLMKKAWRVGDMVELKRISLDPWVKDFPLLYENLLIKRNKAWMKKILKMSKTKEIEFILFGALHLVGEEGILNKLKNKGFTLSQLK